MSTDNNMSLWQSVEKTDPAQTKEFTGRGGFKGTAVRPLWLIRRATEQWGPMGGKWGARIVNEQILEGAPILTSDGTQLAVEKIHCVQIELFHPGGFVPAFGQTVFVGRNKNGLFTDEDAPKKSLTDAVSKGLSWLGFAADIHLGKFDDHKYVNDLRNHPEEFQVGPQQPNGISDNAQAWLEWLMSTPPLEKVNEYVRELGELELAEKRIVWDKLKQYADGLGWAFDGSNKRFVDSAGWK